MAVRIQVLMVIFGQCEDVNLLAQHKQYLVVTRLEGMISSGGQLLVKMSKGKISLLGWSFFLNIHRKEHPFA